MALATKLLPPTDANRLGLLYRHEATQLPWRGPIWDVHTHIADLEAAKLFFKVCDVYGIEKVWSMTKLEEVDAIKDHFGDRIEFIAVPNYSERNNPNTFTTDWLKRLEGFAERGVRIAKFWAAPRSIDFAGNIFNLDSPIRREAMNLARSLGMMFMTHIADPDTWFATAYADHRRYGTKAQHHQVLERALDDYHDVTWIAAHLGGHPEDLDHLQRLLDRYPNLHLDTSATKWMVRELSKHPREYHDFCQRNPGRVLFGSDNVATTMPFGTGQAMSFDLLASRYWALRTFYETSYHGPSPIVDPDLRRVDPSLPRESTPTLKGAKFDPTTLAMVYHDAAKRLLVDR